MPFDFQNTGFSFTPPEQIGSATTSGFGSSSGVFGAKSFAPSTSSSPFSGTQTSPFGRQNSFDHLCSGTSFGSFLDAPSLFGSTPRDRPSLQSIPETPPPFGPPPRTPAVFVSYPEAPSSSRATSAALSMFGLTCPSLSSDTSSSLGNDVVGSTSIPYSPTPLEEGEDFMVMSISHMPAYRDKSHEELRFIDYQMGIKGAKSDPLFSFADLFALKPKPISPTSPNNNPFAPTPQPFTPSDNPFAPKQEPFSPTDDPFTFPNSSKTITPTVNPFATTTNPISASESRPFGIQSTKTPTTPFGSVQPVKFHFPQAQSHQGTGSFGFSFNPVNPLRPADVHPTSSTSTTNGMLVQPQPVNPSRSFGFGVHPTSSTSITGFHTTQVPPPFEIVVSYDPVHGEWKFRVEHI